ncbi:MAG: GNAT family N-acetyltransferase [Rhizobiaceae bacterium]
MTTLAFDIRPAEQRDAYAIANVHSRAWENAYSGIIPHKTLSGMIARRGESWWKQAVRGSNSVLLAEVGGKLAGYATIGRNRTRQLAQQGEIYELYLQPEYQGLGFGGHLFAAARSRIHNMGMKGIVVWALEDNARALGFYEALGGIDVAEGTENFEGRQLRKIAFVWN